MSVPKIDCDRCDGTGMPAYGPPDAGYCGACNGRGWFEVEDDWCDDRRDYERDERECER